jgi:hypothetical protein
VRFQLKEVQAERHIYKKGDVKIMATIKINESGHIEIPLKDDQKSKFKDNDYVKVNVKSDRIVIVPTDHELDEELIKALIHDGIIIDIPVDKKNE